MIVNDDIIIKNMHTLTASERIHIFEEINKIGENKLINLCFPMRLTKQWYYRFKMSDMNLNGIKNELNRLQDELELLKNAINFTYRETFKNEYFYKYYIEYIKKEWKLNDLNLN